MRLVSQGPSALPEEDLTSPTSREPEEDMYEQAMQLAAADCDLDVDGPQSPTNTSKCEQPMVEFDVFPFAANHFSIEESVFLKMRATIHDIYYVASPEERAKFARLNEERGNIDLGEGGGNETIAKLGTEEIKYSTVYRIYTKDWLDDVSINVYMKMLAAIEASLDKEQGDSRQNRNLFFTSHFVARLRAGTSGIQNTGYHYPNVAKWTKDLTTDLCDYDKVFFPCNIPDAHWFLIVVDNNEKTVSLYDPLHASRMDYLNNVRQYVYDEYERSNTAQIPWKYVAKDMGGTFPGQADTCSCGVYTCLYANRISQGYELDTIQSVNGAFQYRMYMLCLLNPLLQI
jgi:sentrin-specific protease 1